MQRSFNVVLGYAVVAGVMAAIATFWGQDLPIYWHRAILGIMGGLAAVVSGPAFAVFTKLDGILKDAEQHDALQVKRIYTYVHAVRVRLLGFFLVAVFSGLTAGAISLLLASATADGIISRRWVLPLGYAGAALIVLFTLRIAHVYANLDRFRRRLFEEILAEKRRADALRELRPSALREFTPPDQRIAVS
jgi:hypothetical protein